MAIFAEVSENKFVRESPLSKAIVDQYCAISKWCEKECQLILFTNRNSHANFRLVPNAVIFNDIKWRNDRLRPALFVRQLSFSFLLSLSVLYKCSIEQVAC